MNTYRFWVPLVSLSDSLAMFQNTQTGVAFSMTVDHWVKIGRPGAVELSPVAAPA